MNKKALDIGTGNGYYLLKLTEMGYYAIGVDKRSWSLPKDVESAERKGKIKIIIDDIFSYLANCEDRFDLVSIRYPDELAFYLAFMHRESMKFLGKICGILNVDGIFVVTSRIQDFPYENIINTIEGSGYFKKQSLEFFCLGNNYTVIFNKVSF